MPNRPHIVGRTATPFPGFEDLSANYIYCPNQFLDVCLPHYSRGTVRLVAYILYRTLRWRDDNGNPIEQDISVPYGDLIAKAGISRGAISKSIDDAIAGGFIVRISPARPKANGQAALTARYALRWDSGNVYIKDPKAFQGFYAGDGHRSPIPLAFFDRVIRVEALTVAKVVGTVLRHTVGYENQFGRRAQAPLSYSFIQRYAQIGDRTTLSQAVTHAIDAGYVRRVESGHFDKNTSKQKAATYAVNWLARATNAAIGSKTLPVAADRFKNPTSNGSQTRPADRFKNQTTRKKDIKETFKQQHDAAVDSITLLQQQGFDLSDAKKIVNEHSAEQIARQVDWLEFRQPSKNRLGMLRRSIEEDWSEPTEVKQHEALRSLRQRQEQEVIQQAAEEAKVVKRKRERRRVLLARWKTLSIEEQDRIHRVAEQRANSAFLRRRIHAARDFENPSMAVLLELERDSTNPDQE